MSRYVSLKYIDSCLSPITIWHNGISHVVPCNKCDACRLNRANDWSQRLGAEIASTPYTIWTTLTYNNKYVPKLTFVKQQDKYILTSNNDYNIRNNSVRDVVRDDDINIISGSAFKIPTIQHFDSHGDSYCTYLSKRDIQLFLKILRQKIYEKFGQILHPYQYSLRYYVIGEYGPSTLRAHYHALFFVQCEQVKDFILATGLFESWQMCDKSLLQQYTSLAGDGVRNYVTDYVTTFSRLPDVYKDKEIRPFRLSSKSPSIGFVSFDEQKVQQDVESGVIEYNKRIDRIDKNYTLVYPRSYIDRLFPKTESFSQKSFDALLSSYGLLYHLVVQSGFPYDFVLSKLRKDLSAVKYYATKRCYEFCVDMGCRPDYFVWLVDRKEYLYSMRALRQWYTWQEQKAQEGELLDIARSYNNLGSWYRLSKTSYQSFVFDNFTSAFALPSDLSSDDLLKLLAKTDEYKNYALAVGHIVDTMDKSHKIKEYAQAAPTNNPLIF